MIGRNTWEIKRFIKKLLETAAEIIDKKRERAYNVSAVDRGRMMMNVCELTAAITALANTIACQMNDGELTVIAAVLVQLGDTLSTIAARRAVCGS